MTGGLIKLAQEEIELGVAAEGQGASGGADEQLNCGR